MNTKELCVSRLWKLQLYSCPQSTPVLSWVHDICIINTSIIRMFQVLKMEWILCWNLKKRLHWVVSNILITFPQRVAKLHLGLFTCLNVPWNVLIKIFFFFCNSVCFDFYFEGCCYFHNISEMIHNIRSCFCWCSH